MVIDKIVFIVSTSHLYSETGSYNWCIRDKNKDEQLKTRSEENTDKSEAVNTLHDYVIDYVN